MLINEWTLEDLEINAFIECEIRNGTYCEFITSILPTKERWKNRLLDAIKKQDRVAAMVAAKYWKLH